LLALSLPSSYPNPTFNLGRGGEMHLIDLYLTLAKILKKKPNPVRLPPRPGEQDRYCVDIKKATRALGWKPRVKLEEGLRETLLYWKLI
jgi:nucleoside-diphosphate-sugar epimerase